MIIISLLYVYAIEIIFTAIHYRICGGMIHMFSSLTIRQPVKLTALLIRFKSLVGWRWKETSFNLPSHRFLSIVHRSSPGIQYSHAARSWTNGKHLQGIVKPHSADRADHHHWQTMRT